MESADNLSRVTRSVAAILTDACAVNSDWALWHDPCDLFSSFECEELPPISVAQYMSQVERVAGSTYWLQCLILIDELCRMNKVPVAANNVHRLVVTAYSIALKVSVDGTGLPPLVAAAGGIAVDDLVEMEAAFLQLLDWRVHVGGAAHAKLVAGLRIVKSTARSAAARTPDRPITLVPAAVVPRAERFELAPAQKLSHLDCAKADRSSGCSSLASPSESESTEPAPALSYVPCPPKKDRDAPRVPRREAVLCAGGEHRESPQSELADSRRSAGKRMESAIGYARCCEQD